MGKRRVVVTGMGVVSCFGNDVDHFYRCLLEGKSGVTRISSFSCDELPTKIAAEIKEFDPGGYLDKKQARRVDKFIAYSIVAGKKTLEHGGVNEEALQRLSKDRCGVIIGSGMGGMEKYVEGVTSMHEKGVRKVSPFFIPFIITNMGGAVLAMEIGFKGPNYSISTACATGSHSIIAAANHIRTGEADLMLAGGVEAPILPMGLSGFCACRALSTRNDEPEKASRPWDKERDGFVMGEGAGVLLLEELEHAKARGATIYAEYLGGGVSCDAYHITEPDPEGEGVGISMRSAIKQAEIAPEEIDYINAHATSTPVGDMAEISAVKKVIPVPEKVAINSTKSMIGHCLGAAGAVEAVAAVKTIEEGKVHPTINLKDPEAGLDFIVPTEAMDFEVNVAASNSFGFGGHNATLLIGKLR